MLSVFKENSFYKVIAYDAPRAKAMRCSSFMCYIAIQAIYICSIHKKMSTLTVNFF